MDVGRFIDAVHARPELWDSRNKLHYNHRKEVRTSWLQLAKEFGIKVDAAKTKWKNLRDTFRCELKKIAKSRAASSSNNQTGINSDGDDEEAANTPRRHAKWVWHEKMNFLKSVMVIPPYEDSEDADLDPIQITLDDDMEYPCQVEAVTLEEATADVAHQDMNTVVLYPPVEEQEDSFQNVMPSKRQKRIENSNYVEYSSNPGRDYHQTPTMFLEPIPESAGLHQDDSYYFLMSLLPIMRRLPLESRLRSRIKIQEILMTELQATMIKQESEPDSHCNPQDM